MGTSLTGLTPSTTYDALIKVGDNGPLSGTLKTLSDGLGNDSAISLSTGSAKITGTLDITGITTFNSNSADAQQIQILGNNSSFIIGADKGGGASIKYNSNGNLDITPRSGFSSVFPSGNVGIGTATPSALLTLNGTTPFIRIERTGVPTWQIQNNTLVSNPGFSINNITNAATPLFIDGTTNNVGIGTASPNAVLEVAGGTSTTNTIVIGQSDNGTIASRHSIVFQVDRNNDVGGRVVQFKYGGNGYGTGTSIATFTQNGLCFNNDTSASNALDDYEEGTFTATLTPSTSGTITLSSNTCTYTKIGRQVTIKGFLSVASVSLAVGTVVIMGGLPFTTLTGNSARGAGSVSYFPSIGASNSLVNYQLSNSTEFNFIVTASSIVTGDEFYVTLTYFV